MAWFKEEERRFGEWASKLMNCNPFLPEWTELERKLLGDAFVDDGPVWSLKGKPLGRRENLRKIDLRLAEMADRLHARLTEGAKPNESELKLYEDMVLLLLYERFSHPMLELALRSLEDPKSARRAPFYVEFQNQAWAYLQLSGRSQALLEELPHLFACFYQIRRAFHHIFSFIVGPSLPTARLRAAIWQSVFTHDMRRYRRGLYRHMGELTTLITGPSGSGKELVARAIGLSQYLPFNERSHTFTAQEAGAFHALDLSALSPTLIESELFGHRKGAFTGAQTDHPGWLEVCPPDGAVFLDEIGELSASIQVKLLRVLETRSFQRMGETLSRRFQGKVIVATNRDLEAEIAAGRFRADLYYRLCSDVIVAPSLQERLADHPGELRNLLRYIARQTAGEGEAEELAQEVEAYIAQHLGMDYPWPGNIRELAQCVRNILVRKEYRPARLNPDGAIAARPFAKRKPWSGVGPSGPGPSLEPTREPQSPGITASWGRRPQPNAKFGLKALSPREHFWAEASAGRLSADELLNGYVSIVHNQAGSYEETARRLGLDRRTVKTRLERAKLAEQ